MNFLAHIVLAPQTPPGMAGSIAPDLIRGPLPATLPAAVMASALEHQRIDRFTDRHPAFIRARQRLRRVIEPRLAGVLADVVFDHILARDWPRWHREGLGAYVAEAEQALSSQLPVLPEDARWRVRLMIDQQWLTSYASVEGMLARLGQMSARLTRRLGRPMSLVPAADDLERLRPDLADDFDELWADLHAFVAEQRLAEPDRLAS